MSFNKIIISLLVCLLYGCSYDPIYQKKHYVFGTLVDLKIYGEEEETAKKISNEIKKNTTSKLTMEVKYIDWKSLIWKDLFFLIITKFFLNKNFFTSLIVNNLLFFINFKYYLF